MERKGSMIAARIRQRLESDTIRIPDAAAFIGKEVEVIVLLDASLEAADRQNPRKQIRGSAKGQVWLGADFDEPLPDDLLFSIRTRSTVY
jgi:hypothetical protein